MRRLLAHNPKFSSAALFLAVAGVAAHQMWMSAQGPLTAWKGGGFGMYTAPHINDRQVWLLLPGGSAIRLHPATPTTLDRIASLDPGSARFLRGLLEDAEHLRSFPTDAGAISVLRRASRVAWPDSLDPARGLAWPAANQTGTVHALPDLQLRVTELARRPSVGRFEQSEIFALSGEDAE